MPPMFYGAYLVGSSIIGTSGAEFEFQLSWEWLMQSIETIGPAFILGCAICGIVFGALGYFSLNLLWRLSVKKAWEKRWEKRQRKKVQ